MDSRVALNEVDGVEITSIVDNTVDFLSTTERKRLRALTATGTTLLLCVWCRESERV